MKCKVCGRELNIGDRFCSNCGSRVLEGDFFSDGIDSESKSADIMRYNEDESRSFFDHEDFDWNIDGYPNGEKKKTEEIDFDWKSVLNDREKQEFDSMKEMDQSCAPLVEGDEKFTLEDLFEESRLNDDESMGTNYSSDNSKTTRVDKFFTFNKKNEEFQKLLDDEYERLKDDDGLYDYDFSVSDYEDVNQEAGTDDVMDISDKAIGAVADENWGSADDSFDAGRISEDEKSVADGTYVNVMQVEEPQNADYEEKALKSEELESVNSDGDASLMGIQTAENLHESEKLMEEENTEKLTFSDVFKDDEDEDNASRGKVKKHRGLKIIIIILCILIVLELVVIGIQYLAPDTAIGRKLSELSMFVVDKFTGQ